MCIIHVCDAMPSPGDGLVERESDAERGVLAGRPARVAPFGVVEGACGEREDRDVVAGDVEAGVATPAAEKAAGHGAREGWVLEAGGVGEGGGGGGGSGGGGRSGSGG